MMNEDSEKVMKTDKIVKHDKKAKRGIIYLSTIPKYMNVTMIREIFSAYGEVDRVYLQLDESNWSHACNVTYQSFLCIVHL